MQNKYFRFTMMIAALGLFIVVLNSFGIKRTVWLSSLDLTKMVQAWDKPLININRDKKPLSIGKKALDVEDKDYYQSWLER